jgi:RND superfamily putative drug exporter
MVRLASWSQRHHWLAIALWAVCLVAITGISTVVGSDYRNDFSLPGTESQALTDAVDEHAPNSAGDTVTVIVQSDDGVATESDRIAGLVDDLSKLDHVSSATAPAAAGGTVSDDGEVGLISVQLDTTAASIPDDDVRAIIDTAKAHESDNLRVELSGDAVRSVEGSGGGPAEGAGLLAALVVLFFMFGSLLAATLPIITAVFAVGATYGLVALASNVIVVPDYTAPILILVGLGVGIDYALLIFARFRRELLGGASRLEATVTALDTAGRSVLFAGITVVIALLGLYALGLGSLQGIALAVALTVLMTMLASLTLLPSLLTIFGKRIERRVRRHAERARREPGARWRAWAGVVQRRPVPALLVALVSLGVLIAPMFGMRLGFADAGTDDPSSTSKQAYDLVAEHFGPGFNGPLLVVTDGDEDTAQTAYDVLAHADGVELATPPQASPDGAIYTSVAFPTTAPQDAATTELVHRLRADLPAESLVGGPTAATIDFSTAVADRMPLFVAIVIGLSALLLLFVFRSIPIAIKAAILNLLSIGASLGVITLVFQHGWFGITPAPIEAFVPVMIFAIVFGLSMDYEVFLVSGMHEAWVEDGDATHAVREGLARTGGVITAAAAIMIVVFASFLLSGERMLQQFGLGLAVAVLLDAVVIRCLIVPAVMRLLGRHAWWTPAWLLRVIPAIRLEGSEPEDHQNDDRHHLA